MLLSGMGRVHRLQRQRRQFALPVRAPLLPPTWRFWIVTRFVASRRWTRLCALAGLVSLALALPVALQPHSATSRPASGARARITPGGRAVRLDSGIEVRLRPGGFVYQAGAARSVGLQSVGAPLGRTVWRGRGAVSTSPMGPVSVAARHGAAEVLQTVERHLGLRVWRWRLDTRSQPRVSSDGSVGFFDPRTHLLDGVVVSPVRVLDPKGRDVTPAATRWTIAVHGRSQFLELRLDDARLPLPYTIDPIATRDKASNVGSSGMTITVPSTVEAGDLIVVHAAVVGGTGVSSISPLSGPPLSGPRRLGVLLPLRA